MKAAGAALALLLTLSSSTAIACGHCVEDRIAAVYDHALLQRTLARKHQVAYFALEGPLPRGEESRQKILKLVETTPGVGTGSTRVSLEPAALAVTFDPQRSSAESLEAVLQKKLRTMKVTVLLLQSPQVHK